MPMKIAIVDDNATNLMIIEKILQKAGYNRLVLLSSAKELYQYLQLDAPNPAEVSLDLILMDLMMPRMGGLEATRRIMFSNPAAKIVVVTGRDGQSLREAAETAGACAFVSKENLFDLRGLIKPANRLSGSA